MEYSFKKHIHNEYYTYLLYLMVIIFFGFYIGFPIFFIIYTCIRYKVVDFVLLVSLMKLISFLPIISLVSFIICLLRINSVKKFLNNCFEVEARIEKYLAYFGSRNYTQKEGTETAIRVIFSYTIDGNEYKKGYSISNNKYTIKYFDLYKKKGQVVKILVSNKNPKRIIIKDLFN